MPDFCDTDLTPQQLDFTNRIMSSDALAAQVITRIKNKTPTSVIRLSDGERGIIDYALTNKRSWFMTDNWFKRYGLLGADLKRVGEDLLWAGNNADYTACTISGVFWSEFDVQQYFQNLPRYIDQFYPQLWLATDRVGHVLRQSKVLVLHREHHMLVPVIKDRYKCDVTGLCLDSHKDHTWLTDEVKASDAGLVLVSGGASGKPFVVRLAQYTGKVVLDIGESLKKDWCA